MTETRLVQGQGGAIYEMDVPRVNTPQRELWDYMFATGARRYVDFEVEEYETRSKGKALRRKHPLPEHWASEDVRDEQLEDLSKDQLLAVAHVRGVEGVDGRTSKPNLIKAIEGQEPEPDAAA